MYAIVPFSSRPGVHAKKRHLPEPSTIKTPQNFLGKCGS